MAARKRGPQLWSPTVASTGWSESTLAEKAWVEARGATVRWAIVGAILGALVGLVVFAPASWLASAIASATGQRLILADARGTVWSGSAVAVLAGGPDSRDATYLPGRLEWTLTPRWYGVDVAARQECCINGTATIQIRPGFGRIRATLGPRTDWVGQWPSAWLGGLGTPWNTLQLGGSFRLLSPGVTIESVEGRSRLEGKLELVLDGVSSRLTTLDTLGSYRITLERRRQQHPDAAHGDDAGRSPAAERQRHLGSGRRQVPRRGAGRRRTTRRHCRTFSTSSVGATARGRSFRSDENDLTQRLARELAAQDGRDGDRGGARLRLGADGQRARAGRDAALSRRAGDAQLRQRRHRGRRARDGGDPARAVRRRPARARARSRSTASSR